MNARRVAVQIWVAWRVAALGAVAGLTPARAAEAPAPVEPRTYAYRQIDDRTLNAYVFAPTVSAGADSVSGILLFHGGGWSAGAAEWTFDAARRFASWGLVAISIEYRLSEGDVTPIEAFDDVCAAFS